jgi:hypothetical protein
MRDWNLKSGDPLTLILAADARLGPTDYLNDQIWELTLGNGAPPALALQTTFGLRARIHRLFPIFREGDTERVDPDEFTIRPTFHKIYPNYISLKFSPFPDIDVAADFWVPEPQAVAGRLRMANLSKNTRKLQIDWVGQLSPTDGERMSAAEMQAATVLKGQTSNLALIFFLTGGPKAGTGSYPSLALDLEMPSGSVQDIAWAHVAKSNHEESFNLARNLASHNWDAVRVHAEMLNAGQIEIYTGDPDWDATLMLAQKSALNLMVGPTDYLPFASFVQTRLPDQGYSLRGDGSDYNHLWNGQSPLEALYLADILLPIVPEMVKGLLRNFLSVQSPDGSIDWKPGLAGQRSRMIATPVLASLAWRIYEFTEDLDFLREVFPALVKFLLSWFTPSHDRDGDGIPEWANILQSELEDHPLYSNWQENSLGLEISTGESPALCAFLYRECQTLLHSARLLSLDDHIPTLQFLSMRLKVAVEAAWSSQENVYLGWDRDTHLSTLSELIGQVTGPGIIQPKTSFSHPARLLFQLHSEQTSRPRPQITIYGFDLSGKEIVYPIPEDKFKWWLERGLLTTEQVFSNLDRIEVKNLEAGEQLTVYWAGHRSIDYGSLLPLWAGLPDNDHTQSLVEQTLVHPHRFWRDFGLPSCIALPGQTETLACTDVNLTWNSLIGEGLVDAGFRQQAATLVMRIMSALIQTVKLQRAFQRTYHADNGRSSGERNALNGLPPLGLFMHTLGVRLISPYRVALSGINPFPWAVTVKYRGLTVLRQKEKTIIIFPDGQTVMVRDPKPQLISLEIQQVELGSRGG